MKQRGELEKQEEAWQTSADIRRRNARALLNQVGTEEFGVRTGMSKQEVSQYLGRHPIRNLGPTKARGIETAFGLPANWLDSAHDIPTAEPVKIAESGAPGYHAGLLRQRVEEVETIMVELLERIRELRDHIKRL